MLWCLVCKSSPFFRVGKPLVKESETLSQNVVINKRFKNLKFEVLFDTKDFVNKILMHLHHFASIETIKYTN